MRTIQVPEMIDEQKFNRFHLQILLCCIFIIICDGYDWDDPDIFDGGVEDNCCRGRVIQQLCIVWNDDRSVGLWTAG